MSGQARRGTTRIAFVGSLLMHLVISALVGMLVLVMAFGVTVSLQYYIQGDAAFDHDAGAQFAASGFGLLVAAPLALGGFLLVLLRLRSKYYARIRDST